MPGDDFCSVATCFQRLGFQSDWVSVLKTSRGVGTFNHMGRWREEGRGVAQEGERLALGFLLGQVLIDPPCQTGYRRGLGSGVSS